MTSVAFWGAIEIGLVYGIVAAGVYLSFRVFNFPDLTVDGSFPLGAAVTAVVIVSGHNPWLGLPLAMIAGFCAGITTAWLNQRFDILHLLASILTMTALYSINLRIMGRPNTAFLGEITIVDSFAAFPPLYKGPVIGAVFALAVFAFLTYFLSTRTGLGFRASGANPRMARAMGVSVRNCTYWGLGLSNALVALSGALFAQMNGFADITLGLGVIIIGLASVISGESLLRPKTLILAVAACFLGSVLYRLAIAWALHADALGLRASDLSFLTAALVALALIVPRLRRS